MLINLTHIYKQSILLIHYFLIPRLTRFSACLLCLLILGCGWRGNMIPLVKGIHSASSQPGSPCLEAEGDGLSCRESPENPPDSCSASPLGHAPGLHPAQEITETNWAGKNRELQQIQLRKISRCTSCAHQGAPHSQATLLRTLQGCWTGTSSTCCWSLLMCTSVHASKHTRSVFIGCD